MTIKDTIIPAAPGTRVIEVYLDGEGNHREWHHYVIAWLIRDEGYEVVPIVPGMDDGGALGRDHDDCKLVYPAPDGTYTSQGCGNIKRLEDVSDDIRDQRKQHSKSPTTPGRKPYNKEVE